VISDAKQNEQDQKRNKLRLKKIEDDLKQDIYNMDTIPQFNTTPDAGPSVERVEIEIDDFERNKILEEEEKKFK
jgi:hypothetical protein